MAAEREPIEINDKPELLRLVEEMEASGQPCVLTRDGKEVAFVTSLASRELEHARPASATSGLAKLIGFGTTPEPTDVGASKHEYLADAYSDNHRE
jgi:hypothetical protein